MSLLRASEYIHLLEKGCLVPTGNGYRWVDLPCFRDFWLVFLVYLLVAMPVCHGVMAICRWVLFSKTETTRPVGRVKGLFKLDRHPARIFLLPFLLPAAAHLLLLAGVGLLKLGPTLPFSENHFYLVIIAYIALMTALVSGSLVYALIWFSRNTKKNGRP